MWAHYADSSQGMCVEYDLSALKTGHPALNYLFPVFYSDKRYVRYSLKDLAESQRCLENDIEKCTEIDKYVLDELKGMEALYLTKGEKWDYEKEWRLLVPKFEILCSNHSPFNNRTFDFPCATKIFLGPRMPPDIKEFIRKIADYVNKQRNKEEDAPLEVKEMELLENGYDLKEKEV